jgi:hypothetical protein
MSLDGCDCGLRFVLSLRAGGESPMPTKDYIIQTQGRRQLQLNKQDDGTYQVKVFLAGPGKTLATLIVTEAEMKKLANYSAGLLKK